MKEDTDIIMQKIIATIAALLATLFAFVSVFSQTEKTALKRKSESKLLVAQTKCVVVDKEFRMSVFSPKPEKQFRVL